MRNLVLAFIVCTLVVLSLGITFRSHFLWRTSRIIVSENGRAIEKPEVFAGHDWLYVQLPGRKFEAYIIDFAHKTVIHNQPHRFVSLGFVLFSQDIPPVGPEFGKLEREWPHFGEHSVVFRSDTDSQVEVRTANSVQ